MTVSFAAFFDKLSAILLDGRLYDGVVALDGGAHLVGACFPEPRAPGDVRHQERHTSRWKVLLGGSYEVIMRIDTVLRYYGVEVLGRSAQGVK